MPEDGSEWPGLRVALAVPQRRDLVSVAAASGQSADAGYRTIRSRDRKQRSKLSRWYRGNERTVLGITGLVSFFVLWQILAMLGLISEFFFSSPLAILAAGIALVESAGGVVRLTPRGSENYSIVAMSGHTQEIAGCRWEGDRLIV